MTSAAIPQPISSRPEYPPLSPLVLREGGQTEIVPLGLAVDLLTAGKGARVERTLDNQTLQPYLDRLYGPKEPRMIKHARRCHRYYTRKKGL